MKDITKNIGIWRLGWSICIPLKGFKVNILFYVDLCACVCEQKKGESKHVTVHPWVSRFL